MGHLQCPLVCLPSLLEGIAMLVSSTPQLGFLLMDGATTVPCGIFLRGGSVAPPMHLAPQRGQDVIDWFLPLAESTRQQTWWSPQQIYTMIKVPDLFVGGLVPHKFNGGCVYLWVWSQQPLPASPSRQTSLPPFSLVQWHVETFHGGWWTSGACLSPILDIHPGIVQHWDTILPLW